MKLALIGEKLGHSYSKLIHGFCGLDYSLVEVKRNELCEFVKNSEFDGFNVTVPYKQDVFALLDGASDTAKRIGAVNTVIRRDGKLFGYNTDHYGIIYAFERMGVSVKGKRVCILGTGGAARAATVACEDLGAARIDRVGRTSAINYSNCYDVLDPQILINATPVGMFPNLWECPADPKRFRSLVAVFDCIYNPYKTRLLKKAEECGVKTENGLAMLIGQAVKAQELWTGEKKSAELFEELLRKVKAHTLNIALVGMPGSGKSSIGRAVADMLKRPFADTDGLVKQNTGKTPEEIIRASGESVFRDAESDAVKQASSMLGAVIACGGGAVLRSENTDMLKANGVVVYVKRDIALLSSEGRPLSQNRGVESLFNERRQLYEAAADISVENTDIELAAKEVVRAYEAFCHKRA